MANFLKVPKRTIPTLQKASKKNPDKGTFEVAGIEFTVPKEICEAQQLADALDGCDVPVEAKESDYSGLYMRVTGTYTDSSGQTYPDCSIKAIICAGEIDVLESGKLTYTEKDLAQRSKRWNERLRQFSEHIGMKLSTSPNGDMSPGGLVWPGEGGEDNTDVLTSLIEQLNEADFSEPLRATAYQFVKDDVVTVVSC